MLNGLKQRKVLPEQVIPVSVQIPKEATVLNPTAALCWGMFILTIKISSSGQKCLTQDDKNTIHLPTHFH